MSGSESHEDIEPTDTESTKWPQDEVAFEGMITREEIGTASRSCLAILIGLLVLAGLVCVFLAYRFVG